MSDPITASQFRTNFPAFRDVGRFSDPAVNMYLTYAYSILPAGRWANTLDMGAQLYTAHHLAIDDVANRSASAGATPGLSAGVVSSKTAGPVSISFDTQNALQAGAGFWNLTTYGTRFYRMMRTAGIAGIQVGAGCF